MRTFPHPLLHVAACLFSSFFYFLFPPARTTCVLFASERARASFCLTTRNTFFLLHHRAKYIAVKEIYSSLFLLWYVRFAFLMEKNFYWIICSSFVEWTWNIFKFWRWMLIFDDSTAKNDYYRLVDLPIEMNILVHKSYNFQLDCFFFVRNTCVFSFFGVLACHLLADSFYSNTFFLLIPAFVCDVRSYVHTWNMLQSMCNVFTLAYSLFTSWLWMHAKL